LRQRQIFFVFAHEKNKNRNPTAGKNSTLFVPPPYHKPFIKRKISILYFNAEGNQQCQDFGVGEAGILEPVVGGIDVVVFGAAKVGANQVGVLEFATPHIRIRKIATRDVGVKKIGVIDLTPYKLGALDVQAAKIAQLDDAIFKSPIYDKCADLGKNKAQQLTTSEFDILKTAVVDFDIGKIAPDEFAIGKQRSGKLAGGKIAFFKNTIKKFLVPQVLPRAGDLLEFLVFKKFVFKRH
jgi:hypothetical protein